MKSNLIKITDIPIDKISVLYPECQRPYDDKWAQKIADNFDPELFDPITVAGPNEDGIYHPIKGQHRVAAIRKLWPGEKQLVPCLVVAGADRQRAAEIFLQDIGGKKSISAIDRFHVAVTARLPDELEVNEIVKSCGYVISAIHNDNAIFAVTAIMQVFKRYGDITLRRTIQTLTATWPQDRTALQASLIKGYGLFLHTRSKKIDWVQLRTCMQKITPGHLIARGQAKANDLGRPIDVGIEIEISDAYSKLNKVGRPRKNNTIHRNGSAHLAAR